MFVHASEMNNPTFRASSYYRVGFHFETFIGVDLFSPVVPRLRAVNQQQNLFREYENTRLLMDDDDSMKNSILDKFFTLENYPLLFLSFIKRLNEFKLIWREQCEPLIRFT